MKFFAIATCLAVLIEPSFQKDVGEFPITVFCGMNELLLHIQKKMDLDRKHSN